jgi:hypothetical protein
VKHNNFITDARKDSAEEVSLSVISCESIRNRVEILPRNEVQHMSNPSSRVSLSLFISLRAQMCM